MCSTITSATGPSEECLQGGSHPGLPGEHPGSCDGSPHPGPPGEHPGSPVPLVGAHPGPSPSEGPHPAPPGEAKPVTPGISSKPPCEDVKPPTPPGPSSPGKFYSEI